MESKSDEDYIIVDCRFQYEFNGGHIQNSINIQSI
jgi:predicted sulfurtransferase